MLLTKYHRRGITNRDTISDLLLEESPSINMRLVDVWSQRDEEQI